jgi:hypothetical protein
VVPRSIYWQSDLDALAVTFYDMLTGLFCHAFRNPKQDTAGTLKRFGREAR